METSYLAHYGILGQKWGIRRFQNVDGTYTSEGKRRRNVEPHEDYTKAHSKKPISQMSDKELRDRNNRLQMEQQYKLLTKKRNKGMEFVKGFVKVAGTMTAVAGAAKVYKKYVDSIISKAPEDVKDAVLWLSDGKTFGGWA